MEPVLGARGIDDLDTRDILGAEVLEDARILHPLAIQVEGRLRHPVPSTEKDPPDPCTKGMRFSRLSIEPLFLSEGTAATLATNVPSSA